MNFRLARWPWLFALFLALPSLASLPQDAGVLSPFTKTAALNRLTSQVASRGTNVASYAYTLGAAGNRTGVTELNARAVNYAYDPLYRLTGETVGSDPAGSTGTIGYTFDGVGNRLSRSSTISAVPAAAHSYTANDWLASDTYDSNGNTIGTGGMADIYDFENRLVGHGYAITLVYDGDGNRVKKTVGGGSTYYIVDDRNPTGYPQVIEELTAGGYIGMGTPVLQRVYTWGHALISQDQLVNNQWAMSLYGYDGHGSVRYLTDLQGNVTDAYAYDAFGVLIRATGSTPNLYRYCGEQYDPELGFYYLRARYSNPNTGRFWNMDSYEGNSEDPGSLHKYLYCHADPINYNDPSGHCDGIIGAITSVSVQIQLRTVQFVAAHPVYSALGGVLAAVAFPQLEAIPPGHPSPLDEMGQVGRIIRQAIVKGLAKTMMQKHHPLPKFLGGDKVQNFIKIPSHVHEAYHKILHERLKAKGFTLGGLGGVGNSADDWVQHFQGNPGSQQKAFEAVLEAAVDIDATFPDEIAKTGSTMTRAAWQMIIEGKFTNYK